MQLYMCVKSCLSGAPDDFFLEKKSNCRHGISLHTATTAEKIISDKASLHICWLKAINFFCHKCHDVFKAHKTCL